MTTMTTQRDTGGLFRTFLLLVICSATVATFATLADARAECNGHALTKHGWEAVVANYAVQALGGPGHDCPDGRTRWAVRVAPNAWAVKVAEGNGDFVTAFISNSASYVTRMLDPCDPPSGLVVAQ